MPQQPNPSAINNFSQGFKTEYTGLNFPENAVTDSQNCVFERVGNVHRRPGINYEANFTLNPVSISNNAIQTYRWKNVGGDGSTQILVVQIGGTIKFFRSSTATTGIPLSSQLLLSTINMSSFVAIGGVFDPTQECQFADGNGYLFIFHPTCDPVVCTYSNGTITGSAIIVQIRDFIGIVEPGVADNYRPMTLTNEHAYNLGNQGWGKTYLASSLTSNNITGTGLKTWVLNSGSYPIFVGDSVICSAQGTFFTNTNIGTVTSWTPSTATLIVNVTAVAGTGTFANWSITSNPANIQKWFAATGNYPSNSDVWWSFKDTTGTFNPATTAVNVTQDQGHSPQGSFIINAFQQQRTLISGLPGITDVTTTIRPRTGTWFQGRVWYAGVDASQQAAGDAQYYTWTENIYFSQIIENISQFGKCYEVNDPTAQDRFALLPSDGGVVAIQGTGPIYKLFPIQNGLLVFAANGIWFITGSAGIGFQATDFTVSKISAIQSISGTSFIDVQGLPLWWNEEGIYAITVGTSTGFGGSASPYGAPRGAMAGVGLSVQSLTFTTIQGFYKTIPLSSKKFARGDFNPLDWTIRWLFKSTEATGIGVTSRYQFDRVLVLNVMTQAFYYWTIPINPQVSAVNYIQGPGGSSSPSPIFKYLTYFNGNITFSEENDSTSWTDFVLSNSPVNFTSFLVSGYRIKGNAQHRFQTNYLYLYLNNTVNCSYRMQTLWDYAISQHSGKWTNLERVDEVLSTVNFSSSKRRTRMRGRGLVNQFKILSADGKPFDIFGWSVEDRLNQGI